MITSKSPRKVLKLAHQLGQEVLPQYASRFSRKDFTNAQMFACLVLREHQRKSFRGVEALLIDSPLWLADIGLSKAPDHNTLCRAAKFLLKELKANRLLDVTTRWADEAGMLDLNRHPLAIDSTHDWSAPRRRRHTRRALATRDAQAVEDDRIKT